MIDLREVIHSYPNCLSSRASFKSILMDKYPECKRMINILTIMVECGIVQKIKSITSLSDNELQILLLQLEKDYGISPQYSSECIVIWAKAFDIQVQLNKKQVISVSIPKPVFHTPIIELPIVEGEDADYEYLMENGAVTIKKFIGIDEEEIIIPNSINGMPVKVIGEKAFAGCNSVNKVVVSDGITVIEDGAFHGCISLKEISLPMTLQKIGIISSESRCIGVFSETAIEEVQLPTKLQLIGDNTFEYCEMLSKIELPNSIKVLPSECFNGCTALKEVFLPNKLTTIGYSAFSGTGITKIDIPASVTRIESDAFSECEHLTQVLLHEGLVEIEDGAFENCELLHVITIPKSVKSIGKHIFDITDWYQPSDRRRKGYFTTSINSNLVIHCYAGSAGLEFARKEGYRVKNAANNGGI